MTRADLMNIPSLPYLTAILMHLCGIWTVDSVGMLIGPTRILISGVQIENVLTIVWPLGFIRADRVAAPIKDDHGQAYWTFCLPWSITTETSR